MNISAAGLVLIIFLSLEARVLTAPQNLFSGQVGQVNTFGSAGQVNIGAPGSAGTHYPGTHYPPLVSPYPSPVSWPPAPTVPVNSFGGANIGAVNNGCNSPSTCNIVNSMVRGKREATEQRSQKAHNLFTGQVGLVNTFGSAGEVNIGAPGSAVATQPRPVAPQPAPVAYQPGPVAPYPSPVSWPRPPPVPVNSFGGANIGLVNNGCNSAGTCSIVGSTVVGK